MRQAAQRKVGFRQSMTWLHTWSGLTVGWVLYFIFVTGTVGYFYPEIDRWMRPEQPLRTHLPPASQWLAKAESYLRRAAPGAETWMIHFPGGRPHAANYSDIHWTQVPSDANGEVREHRLLFDPAVDDFREVRARPTGGGHLLYRMHWHLYYLPQTAGILIVGACSMIMLVALVTGVIAHRRIFVDLFTFRPGTQPRSWLDAHTITSVLALPFFLMITYSGLVFFAETYVPIAAIIEDVEQPQTELDGRPASPEVRGSAPLLTLETFRAAASDHWGDGHVRTVHVTSPGEAGVEVSVVRNGKGTLLRDVGEELTFGGVSGRLIRRESARSSVVRQVQSTMFGLHEGLFAGSLLRWLYFLSGLLGCAMIASGLVLWTQKRKRKAVATNQWSFGHALVDNLNIGTIVGLPVGIAAYFWANRVLPGAWADRAAWEVHSMFIAWGLMLLYPAMRPPRRAWVEELAIAAGAFALLPALNALTTDQHLGVTIPAGDWALVGFDSTVLALGTALGLAALKVHRMPPTAVGVRPSRMREPEVAAEVG